MQSIRNAIDNTAGMLSSSKTKLEQIRNSHILYQEQMSTAQSPMWAPVWRRMYRKVSETIKSSEVCDVSSQTTSSMMIRESRLAVEKLRKVLQKSLTEKQTDSSLNSRLSFFDLNDLPYISEMRSLFLVACATTFIISPIAYMPLGTIQAAYDQKCFLFTKLRFRQMAVIDNGTIDRYQLLFDNVITEWGPTSMCDLTTFIPVSVSIFAVIIGMSTITIWPTMMSLGRGGALMLLYTCLTILCLIACFIFALLLHTGYRFSCEKMKAETLAFRDGGLPCTLLNNKDIIIKEVRNSHMVANVNRAMVVAQIVAWTLSGLMICKITICILTFGIIWYYLNTK